MIDDETHPDMRQAQSQLMQRLGAIMGDGTHVLTKPFLDSMYDAVRQHRAEWRVKGVDFPVLVALVIPRLGIVQWMRADLDISSIKTQIVNFVRFNPRATMDEVVWAFRAAYPDLKPGDVMQQHGAANEAAERQRKRQEGYLIEAAKELGVDPKTLIDEPPEDGE